MFWLWDLPTAQVLRHSEDNRGLTSPTGLLIAHASALTSRDYSIRLYHCPRLLPFGWFTCPPSDSKGITREDFSILCLSRAFAVTLKMHRAVIEKTPAEDEEALLQHFGEEGHVPTRWPAGGGRSLRSMVTITTLSVLLGISLVTHPLLRPGAALSATAAVAATLSDNEKDALCRAHTAMVSSPVYDDIEVGWRPADVNGSFDKLTVYRQPAGLEVDQAWESLGAYLKPFVVPEDQAERYGLNPGMLKRIPEQGGGFVAVLEGSHHLHCLNVLRQASHFDYPYYRSRGLESGTGLFADTEDLVRLHFSHCLDMLRQRLMCTADTTLLGQVWVEDFGPFVFANVPRKCRNYDDVNRWASDHQVLPASDLLVEKRPGDLVYNEFP